MSAIIAYPTSASKNYQEMLLFLAEFALQEQAEDNLMVAFS